MAAIGGDLSSAEEEEESFRSLWGRTGILEEIEGLLWERSFGGFVSGVD